MNFDDLFPADEQPLDTLLCNGGFTGIFRSIACVGDSLSSGEFESRDREGKNTYHDMYEYSWGQNIARIGGLSCQNFSRGGMTAEEYCESFAPLKGYFDPDRAAQAYILALGVNDMSRVLGGNMTFGSLSDVDFENEENNRPTFCGYYAKIIQKYRRIRPDAFFFLMTLPRSDDDSPERAALYDEISVFLGKLCGKFPHTYLLDLRTYAPVYDKAMREKYYLFGHMNPAGYILTARMVISYMDYIIRHNMKDFAEVGFIGTGILDWRKEKQATCD